MKLGREVSLPIAQIEYLLEKRGPLSDYYGFEVPDVSELKGILGALPVLDAKLLAMKLNGKKQREIAEYFKITQSAVSHRLTKIGDRIRYLIKQPIDFDLRERLKARFDPPTIQMTIVMCGTTNQRLTAQILNNAGIPLSWTSLKAKRWTQTIVRHLWRRVITVCRNDASLTDVFRYLHYIQQGENGHMLSLSPCGKGATSETTVQERLAQTAPWLAAAGATGAQDVPDDAEEGEDSDELLEASEGL